MVQPNRKDFSDTLLEGGLKSKIYYYREKNVKY